MTQNVIITVIFILIITSLDAKEFTVQNVETFFYSQNTDYAKKISLDVGAHVAINQLINFKTTENRTFFFKEPLYSMISNFVIHEEKYNYKKYFAHVSYTLDINKITKHNILYDFNIRDTLFIPIFQSENTHELLHREWTKIAKLYKLPTPEQYIHMYNINNSNIDIIHNLLSLYKKNDYFLVKFSLNTSSPKISLINKNFKQEFYIYTHDNEDNYITYIRNIMHYISKYIHPLSTQHSIIEQMDTEIHNNKHFILIDNRNYLTTNVIFNTLDKMLPNYHVCYVTPTSMILETHENPENLEERLKKSNLLLFKNR